MLLPRAPIGRHDFAGRVNLIASLAPFAFLFDILVLAAYVRLRLGRWPISSDPAKRILPAILDWSVPAAFWIVIVSFPLFLFTIAWLFLQRRVKLGVIRTLIYAGSVLFVAFCLRYDPTTFTDWLFD